MIWNWTKALDLEYRIALVQSQQELYGVKFDLDKAYDLVAELDDKISCLEHQALQELPPIMHVNETKTNGVYGYCKMVFKKDGSYTKYITDNWEDPTVVGGVYTRIKYLQMNLNSNPQVKAYLLTQGWQPTTWNTDAEGNQTSPVLTEDSYASVSHLKLPSIISERAVLVHRRNMILSRAAPEHRGWIPNVRSDGRIEARGIPQATNTGRYRHSMVVNVPKASPKVIYGAELRSLFTVPEGKLLLGCDASGLEARMEAHYCYPLKGGKEYAHELLDGDIHAKNAELFGTDRDGAKAPKYALTYGAQPAKLADTLGISTSEARKYYKAFWEGNTALGQFKDEAARVYEMRGFLKGLDGRAIKVRSPHSAVNAMFQSAGSITVKLATVLLYEWVQERGLDAHQVLHFHDEFQYEIWPEDVEVMTELAEKAFEEAGKMLNIRVPIVGEVKVGKNWKETH